LNPNKNENLVSSSPGVATLFAGCATQKPPQRYAWVTGLKPEKADYYRQLHAQPWPSVNRMIKDCHIQNFSIHEREIDGRLYLFAYFEYTGKDFDADMKKHGRRSRDGALVEGDRSLPVAAARCRRQRQNLERHERSLFSEMKSLVLQQPGVLAWTDAPEPVPSNGEALVRVRRCGVCGTDIHALAGKQPFFSYPRRLGHELCVEVVSAPADSVLRAGDLCAVEAYYFCGTCPACRTGKTNCCKLLKVLGVHIDGGHAPLMAVPADKLHRATKLSPEQIALVEPLVIGAHGVERAAPKAGEPTVIIGIGPIGLAAAILPRLRAQIWSAWTCRPTV
jgi:L-rhamnose mutarotase